MNRSHLITAAALVVAGLFASVASAVATYDIKPLASFNTPDVFAKGINNSGQVVGYTVDAAGDSHAVIWDNAGARELAYNAGAPSASEAYRINDAGQIVGKAKIANGNFQAAMWNGSTNIVPIGTLGGPTSFANDINDAGVVAGSSGATLGSRAFTWTEAGGFVDYGNNNPGTALGQAGFNGINNNGLMVGTSYRVFSPFKAAIARVGDREPTQISPAGQFSTGMALAVNDAGVIVGYQNGGSGSPQAAIFDGIGGFTPLGALGLSDSWAMDVNEDGTIVGTAFGDDGTGNQTSKAFIYENGQMFNLLDNLLDGTGWTQLFDATAINDGGVIVGSGIYNGEIRAFTLTPIPEPAAIGAMFAGAVMMLRRKK